MSKHFKRVTMYSNCNGSLSRKINSQDKQTVVFLGGVHTSISAIHLLLLISFSLTLLIGCSRDTKQTPVKSKESRKGFALDSTKLPVWLNESEQDLHKRFGTPDWSFHGEDINGWLDKGFSVRYDGNDLVKSISFGISFAKAKHPIPQYDGDISGIRIGSSREEVQKLLGTNAKSKKYHQSTEFTYDLGDVPYFFTIEIWDEDYATHGMQYFKNRVRAIKIIRKIAGPPRAKMDEKDLILLCLFCMSPKEENGENCTACGKFQEIFETTKEQYPHFRKMPCPSCKKEIYRMASHCMFCREEKPMSN